MNELQKSLLETVNIISKKNIKDSKPTGTIEAIITSIVNKSAGIYTVQYMESEFSVFTKENSSDRYSIGDTVYVLIPDGDYSKPKFIVGAPFEEKIGSPKKELYHEGEVLFLDNGAGITISNETPSITIPPQSNRTLINTIPKLKSGRNFYNHFRFKTKITTNIGEKVIQNKYELKLIIPYTYKGIKKNKEIILNTATILGNPFKLNNSLQIVDFSFEEGAIIDDAFSISAEGFLEQKAEQGDNTWKIIFSDLEIIGLEEIVPQKESGYSLFIEKEPKGDGTFVLTPAFYIEGVKTSNQTKGISIKWFKEGEPKASDEDYSFYIGNYWQEIKNQDNGNKPIKEDYSLVVSSNPVFYKCFVRYKDHVITKDIQIEDNLSNTFEFEFKSKSGSTNFSSKGTVVLEATYIGNGENNKTFSAIFLRYNEENLLIDEETHSVRETKAEYNFSAAQIQSFNKVKCMIVDENKEVIASKELFITVSDDFTYKITIDGDNKIYKYDANGNSPASDAYSGKKVDIIGLTPHLYDINANDLIDNAIVTWQVPVDSLYTFKGEITKNEDETYYVIKSKDLTYGIKNRYIPGRDNKISLEVNYNGQIFKANPIILFTKDGEDGTNGTNYTAKLTYTANTEGTSCDLNLKVFKDGQEIISDISGEYTWVFSRGKISSLKSVSIPSGEDCPIVQAKVSVDGTTLYTYCPIAYTKTNSIINYPEECPSRILYDADGENPQMQEFISKGYTLETESKDVGGNLIISGGFLSAKAKFKDEKTYYKIKDNKNTPIITCPVVCLLNRYGLSNINAWDGNKIYTNGTDYILSPQFGAGEKNPDNTFTGLIMGEKNTKNSKNIGLYGYSNGLESFSLDSKTGKLILGTPKKVDGDKEYGQIILSPTDGAKIAGWKINPTSLSYGTKDSNNYISLSNTGLEIDGVGGTISLNPNGFSIMSKKGIEYLNIEERIAKIGGCTIADGKIRGDNGKPNKQNEAEGWEIRSDGFYFGGLGLDLSGNSSFQIGGKALAAFDKLYVKEATIEELTTDVSNVKTKLTAAEATIGQLDADVVKVKEKLEVGNLVANKITLNGNTGENAQKYTLTISDHTLKYVAFNKGFDNASNIYTVKMVYNGSTYDVLCSHKEGAPFFLANWSPTFVLANKA